MIGLTEAIIANDVAKVQNLLEAEPCNVDVNETIKDGCSPLQYAVSQQNVGMAKLLVDNGANVRVKSCKGRTLLHSIAVTGNVSLLDLFVPLIDVNEPNDFGSTPLHFAAIHNKFEMAQHLLKNNAKINLQSANGNTPLHFAFHQRQYQMIELFLRSGADSRIRNNDGNVAYKRFRFSESKRVGFMLLQRDVGADLPTDCNNYSTWEKLFLTVVQCGSYEDVEKCIKLYGPKLSSEIKNSALQTVLSGKNTYTSLVYLLIKFGAYTDRINRLDDSEIIDMVIKSVACLSVQDLNFSEKYISHINSTNGYFSADYKLFLHELQVMKKTEVCEDFRITYFDVYIADLHKLPRLLRSTDIRSTLETGKYKKMFPHFSKNIEFNLAHALEKVKITEELCEILKKILQKFALPAEIAFKIIDYLSFEEVESCFKVKSVGQLGDMK